MDSQTVAVKKTLRKIALVGTPNSGKTSLFNLLTGLNQKVGNFPGVTVERKSAPLRLQGNTAELVDLPGCDSLYPHSADEAITCSVLRNPAHSDHPDLVIVVTDATQLRRGLMLCSQVMDMGYPTILAINMADLLDRKDLGLIKHQVAQAMGIPVVIVSALKKQGIKELKQLVDSQVLPSRKTFLPLPGGFAPALSEIKTLLKADNDYIAFQALMQPEEFSFADIEQLKSLQHLSGIDKDATQLLISNELTVRKDRVNDLLASIDSHESVKLEYLTQKIDRVLTHRIWGYVIFLVLLVLIFQSIFSWANYPMDLIDGGVERLKGGVSALLPDSWVTDLITEGILTGFGGIVIFIPQIAFLFLFIAIMEESGYMSRVVFLMDRIMRPFGFSGKSVIPLMGGMACAIPSIMMTRNINNRIERLITMMVTPLMSCSARIPVYTLLIAMFIPAERIYGIDQRGLFMTGLYLLGFITALGVAWVFKKALRYNADGIFVMEMPAYRMPRWRNIGLTVYQKVIAFVFGAGKIILAISIILWVLVSFGPSSRMEAIDRQFSSQIAEADEAARESLEWAYQSARLEQSYAAIAGKFIEPVIRPLGYDWKIGISLITSFAAREVFVGTMSIIYNQEDPDSAEGEEAQEAARGSLIRKLRSETWEDTGEPVYSMATVFSLIIFYAFAMQCMSTLAVTRREAGWAWAGVMWAYLTGLAYLASLVTYQILA